MQSFSFYVLGCSKIIHAKREFKRKLELKNMTHLAGKLESSMQVAPNNFVAISSNATCLSKFE